MVSKQTTLLTRRKQLCNSDCASNAGRGRSPKTRLSRFIG